MATESGVLGVIRASRPSFRNSHDKVAFAIHASFFTAGYSLTAVGSQVESLQPGNEEVGIEGWNEMEDSYAFCYAKTEKGVSRLVIVKGLVMGDMLIVDAAPIGDSNVKGTPGPYNLEINVNDYTKDTAAANNYGEQYKNLSALVEKVNSSILSKLEESPSTTSTSASSRSKTTSGGGLEASQYHVGTGYCSGNDPYSSELVYPPVPPIGGSDLMPGPGAGIYPRRGDTGMGGGMLLGPNDPRWGTGIVGERPLPGGIPGLPPGARFDPFGPPGVPGFEPNRFIRDRRRPPGDGTHPDLEHFSPF